MGTITRNLANNVLTDGTIDATDGLTGIIPASNLANASIDNLTAFPVIVGDFIESVSSDPGSPELGTIWYNSTSGVLKGYQNIGGAWVSSNSVNTARHRIGVAGIQTAALLFGGTTGFQTEEYDGSNWTSLANMTRTTGNQMGAGCGTQTAALGFGGYGPPGMNTASESWNGTSWTATPAINTGRASGGGAGTQTAALLFGGYKILPPGNTYGSFANTESYNGTSWTTVNSMSQTRTSPAGVGLQTAALSIGGMNPIPNAGLTNTEEYNGATWTAGGSLGTARYGGGASSSGTTSAALFFGGSSPVSTKGNLTESYNGTSWTTAATMATARYELGGFGTQTAALAATGSPGAGPASNATEEFTDPTFAIQTIDTN